LLARTLFVLVAVVALAVFGYEQRRTLFLMTFIAGAEGEPPPLRTFVPAQSSHWFDDYYTVEQVEPGIYAIGEPRYLQNNFNYLVVGSERAIVFDAGPGLRNIEEVVTKLTNLPVTFIPSHFHYDHVGADLTFEDIAVVDLPELRARARTGTLRPTWTEHAGAAEGFERPRWQVSQWLAIGSIIDLGGRGFEVIYTPGHTTDSISLYDANAGVLLTGDYLYPGNLYAFLPNSSMGDYLSSADTLLAVVAPGTRIYGAHAAEPFALPRLGYEDVERLRAGLIGIRDDAVGGAGRYPQSFPVSERLSVLAEPRWLQDWD
jgi:glyoxylase-like metal-dependent hydrolase (beta-lactamase superfamily II)